MADIAAVFHWPPSAMAPMDLPELLLWRSLAIERWTAMHNPEG
ncbi:GpE family phage tail protein [Enterococcus faecalis]